MKKALNQGILATICDLCLRRTRYLNEGPGLADEELALNMGSVFAREELLQALSSCYLGLSQGSKSVGMLGAPGGIEGKLTWPVEKEPSANPCYS